ncbi:MULTISPECIES: M23 family metallopeptidase [Pseudomonadaceae]|uniref:M23 family metallopeptidase n=1 Tax=Pseudomonadaceae TaxID=135621 RepID=UPI0015E4478C|nr:MULTISPECIES: M23 family metallopeptidase [Pseudomonadaceae]MBA1279227.1 M23 family metallopeptidase [Stutzerimonas stutzeri]MBC8649347.1 M23 family metallopeptidase [Pseudomonas sp. MT4]QXY90691.1 M23 family metallopeptidase [Pseudomonas sp. MTM4]
MASTRLIVSLALLIFISISALPVLAGGAITNATLPAGKAGTVRLFVNRVGSGKAMDVRNDTDVPVEVVLRLTRMVNVAGVGKGVVRKTVPARTRMRIATLRKRQSGYPLMYQQSFSYSLIYSPEPGKKGSVGGYAYALPWKGGPFRISQGAGGDFSHNSPKGRFAVDIAMPVGTPIVAARAGTVVKIRNDQHGRRPDPAGNYVRILHDDGTHSAYLHLKRGSVQVKSGQQVKIGSLLGQSGNTGRSTGPHLHFVVQKKIEDSLISVPFRFTQPVESLPNFALSER